MFKPVAYFTLFCNLLSCSGIQTTETAGPVGAVPSPDASKNIIATPKRAPRYSTRELSFATNQDLVNVSGHANYESIDIKLNFGDALKKVTKPIRYAQISVFNKKGQVVQNSETNSEGNFSFDLPKNQTLLIVIYTRTQGPHGNFNIEDTCQKFKHPPPNHLDIAAKNCLSQNFTPAKSNIYALQKQITTTANQNLKLTAKFLFDDIKKKIDSEGRYNGLLLGGAFHIFDQLIKGVDFVNDQVCNGSPCSYFSTDLNKLPLLKVYWRAGLNPADTGQHTVSFYNQQNVIAITGGLNKDPLFADADHFDASVILHEFAHYLIDHWSASDSLGGRHGGGIIDPRLAWGEGFANFFQAAVLGRPEYKDYSFNRATSKIVGLNIPIERQKAKTGENNFDVLNETDILEGNFRELSITRLLWDSFDNNQDTEDRDLDNEQNNFLNIWKALGELKNSKYYLRSIGLFNQVIFKTLGLDWSNLLTLHKNTAGPKFRKHFGAQLISCTSKPAETFTLTKRYYISESSVAEEKKKAEERAFYSDYLHNYDIFSYKHTGGSFEINVNYPETSKMILVVAKAKFGKLPSYNPKTKDIVVSNPDVQNLIAVSNPDMPKLIVEGGAPTPSDGSINTTKILASGLYMIILIGGKKDTPSLTDTINYKIQINDNKLCLK